MNKIEFILCGVLMFATMLVAGYSFLIRLPIPA